MYKKIKEKIDLELADFIEKANKKYVLEDTSPLIYNSLKEYILRDGKRIRPFLVIMGFLGFNPKEAPGLYTTALSIEILHDFMLIHDDIVDRSQMRRGLPAMHTVLNTYLEKFENPDCTGEDLAIIIGDILYSIGLDAFLAVDVDLNLKEKALRRFVRAGVFTGMGEFYELENGLNPIETITKKSIYRTYELKTAFYTFAYPLCIGAALAGANDSDIEKLNEYGTYLGRAFQIKDDIIGMFEDEQSIGKSTLTDLEEGKKTILAWYGYQQGNKEQKSTIKSLLEKEKINTNDLCLMRKTLIDTGSLDYAKAQINEMKEKAKECLQSCSINPDHKTYLTEFAEKILKI